MKSHPRRADAKDPPDADLLEIIEDNDENPRAFGSARRWKVLIVDDDPEVHAATRFALAETIILGYPLDLISTYSAAEARDVLEENSDVAVVLLDVVMETHDSGLRFVEWMRTKSFVNERIILRTGQPGYAPELDIIRNYDINDYRSKAELTQTRLITSLTTAIRMFAQLSKLEEQRWNLEAFSRALAHDFKQASRQIDIYSDIISRRPNENNGISLPASLFHLKGATRRLSSLIDVMSQYILLGRSPKIESIDLQSILVDVHDSLSELLTATQGELNTIGNGRCHGNPILMRQILQILIANGLQHNVSGSPKVEVVLALRETFCTVSVRDNGVGIAAENLTTIFEPFMRLQPAGNMSGTGLGLTLCRRAIESQGGSISCESTPGLGSTFHVVFPSVLDDGGEPGFAQPAADVTPLDHIASLPAK